MCSTQLRLREGEACWSREQIYKGGEAEVWSGDPQGKLLMAQNCMRDGPTSNKTILGSMEENGSMMGQSSTDN
eukprot:4739122-Amphidinium_carterae.1